MKIFIYILSLISIFNLSKSTLIAQESSKEKEEKMQWFKDARRGLFIHWGIYAGNGIDESWSFYNGYISYDDYMKQLNGFTAAQYKPEEWASLIKESGAKYAVLTSKHHDGVALWDTKIGELSVVRKTPAGKDLVAPFTKALRKNGLKVGIYYSLLDWSYPDYPNFTKSARRYETDSVRWKRFDSFNHGQIEEIGRNFNPDLYWFDGDWEQNAGKWTKKNAEAIYGTEAGLPPGYFYGPSTLSKDSTMLYLFVQGNPKGKVMLEGVKNKINRIYVAGNGTKLSWKEYLKPYWSDNAGLLFIDVPDTVLDEYLTVIAVVLDGKLELQK